MRVLLLLGDFGMPALSALLSSEHRPVCTVLTTMTDAPPPRSLCQRLLARVRPLLWPGTGHNLPRDLRPWRAMGILQRAGVPAVGGRGLEPGELSELVGRYHPDVLLSVGYSRRVPADLLALPRHGGINVHPSLLPCYRGPSPVFWQIALGESESGVTIHRMTADVDAGPILLQARTLVGRGETAGALFLRLARLAASMLPAALDQLRAGLLHDWTPEPSNGSVQRRFRSQDAVIDWSRPAAELARLVRACSPFPGARTYAPDGEWVFIWRAHARDESTPGRTGEIVARGLRWFDVMTGCGLLRVRTATSGRGLRFPTWFRPWPALAPGARLGAEG